MEDPWIRLSHPDFLSDEMYGQTTKPALDKLRDLSGIMVIKKGLAVAGRVVDQDGTPIAGAKVMQGRDRWGSHYPETKTDAQGQFRFPQESDRGFCRFRNARRVLYAHPGCE